MVVVPGATAMPVLHIQLLGDFRLTYGDEPLSAIVQSRQQSLLAYLVLHRGALLPRQHLAFLFWPDTGEAQALTNLRNLLFKLRQALPEPERFLQADTQTVGWRPDAPCTLDVADFISLAQCATQADLEQAVSLYRGDLLPHCYDEWIVPERERLQHMLLGALEKLVSRAEAARNYSAAIGYAQQLVQRDPLREETYRHLIRLHALNGDRAAAMHVYHTCATTLQRELGVEPGKPTRQAYEQLLNLEAQPSPLRVQAAVLPLVGREREWALLQSLWHEAAASRPHLMLIKGEAGIGKTRLAEELIEWVGRQGAPVLTAHCYLAQGQLAYAPLVEWLRTHPLHGLDEIWLAELARLLPEIMAEHPHLPKPTPLTQDWQRLRLFKALAHALLQDHRSLLLHLEDIQWCDRDTLDWLCYLLQSHLDAGAQVRLLVIGSLRIEEMSPNHPLESLLASLHRADQLTEIELGPLDESATFLLASHVVGHELDPTLRPLLFQGSEGHPLFVVEMARAGLAQVAPHGPDHARAMMQMVPALPLKVRRVIEARLRQLAPPAQDLVGLAAAVGRAFTLNVLQHASSADEETLARGLDELWRRRIIREQGANAYDFSHDKIREVAYAALSLARRRLLHHHIAQALEIVHGPALDSVSGQIATHFELAGRLEQAIPYYQRAAEAAQRVYANADAIRDYGRAIALLEGPTPYPQSLAASLYERLGDVLHWTGQYEEARAVFQQAVASVPHSSSISQARLHRKIGNTWRDQYRYQEALRVYKETEYALDQAPADESAEWWQEWIQVRLEMASVYYWLGQVHESDQLRLKLQPAVEQHGAPAQRAAYFQHIASIEFRRNRSVATDEIVATAKAALAAQQEAGNQAAIPSAQFGVGFAVLWSGNPSGAMEPLQTALHLAEGTGDVSLLARCLTYLTVAYRQCGQREETRRCVARSLEAAAGAHMPEYMGMAKANQAWVTWCAGDLSQAQELGCAALELWHQLPAGHASTPFQWLALWPLIAVALHEGEFSLAMDDARALLDPGQQRLPDALAACLEQAIQAWDGGAPESARALLCQSLALAQQLHYV
jgi:DNA-binding SARP family transcriptional activator